MDLFCKIAKKEIPAQTVYEDEKFIAFLDINPIRLGHTLVIPKEHYDYIFDMPQNLYSDLFLKARLLAPSVQKASGSKRVGIMVEGFGVNHVHVHLVPIDKVGGLDWSKQHKEPEEKLAEMAEMIKSYV